jgi:hypothetical protein
MAAGLAAGITEIAGTFAAVFSIPTLPVMLFSGMNIGQLLGICAVGWIAWGTGAAAGYYANWVGHNIRYLFGDTKASWKESLPESGYPMRDPSHYV